MFMPQAGLPYLDKYAAQARVDLSAGNRLRRTTGGGGGLRGERRRVERNDAQGASAKQKAQLRGHDQLLPENDRLGWPLTLHGQESVEYYQLYV